MNTKEHSYNPITDGKIGKEMLIFFFPILFGSIFQQIYNIADALIVGRYLGKIALSAVAASSGQIVMMIVGFFVALSSGAAVLVSQYYGANDRGNVSKAVHTVIAFSLICGAMITVIGIAFAPQMLLFMKAPEETIPMSIIYLRVYFAGMIGNLIYNVGSGILRAVGDSRRPFIFLVVCCVLNVVLDIIFIMQFQMGVFGAALATILSQLVSAILVVYIMIRQTDSYRLILSKIKIDFHMLKQMIRVGFPAGITSLTYGVSNILIQIAVNGLDTDTVAAWATYYKIDGVFWMTISAFGIVGTTFVGQNIGAEKFDRVRRSVRVNLFQAFTASILISIVVYMISPWLFPLFSKDPMVNQIGVAMMRYLTRFYILFVSIEIFTGILRGAGDTLIPMIIGAVGVCLIRSIWIIFVLPMSNNMYTMMNSYPISWGITSIAFYVYFFKFSKLKQIMRKN